jgi:hypothetical protein
MVRKPQISCGFTTSDMAQLLLEEREPSNTSFAGWGLVAEFNLVLQERRGRAGLRPQIVFHFFRNQHLCH